MKYKHTKVINMGEQIGKEVITQEPGFLYYVKNGSIWRARLKNVKIPEATKQ